MSEYKQLYHRKVTRYFKSMVFLLTAFGLFSLGSTASSRYVDYFKSAERELEQSLNTIMRLRIESNKIAETIANFKTSIEVDKLPPNPEAAILSVYDELKNKLKKLTIDFSPPKKSANIIELPIVIKGTINDLDFAYNVMKFLDSYYYPFIRIDKVSLRFKDNAIDLGLNGSIVTYDINMALAE